MNRPSIPCSGRVQMGRRMFSGDILIALTLAVRLWKEQTSRNWNFPRYLLLGEGRVSALAPTRRGACLPERGSTPFCNLSEHFAAEMVMDQ